MSCTESHGIFQSDLSVSSVPDELNESGMVRLNSTSEMNDVSFENVEESFKL